MVFRLVLIRHGMTEGNREKRYIGSTDEALCDEGRRALEGSAAAGGYPEADVVFVSPMKRCGETAALLYPGLNPVVIGNFRECDFGLFEGKNYRELTGNAEYQAWIDSGGSLPFPGGESRAVFRERCVKGFYQLAAVCEGWEKDKNKKELCVACIVHGGTIMALLEHFGTEGGGYYSYQCQNGQGYCCLASVNRGLIPEDEGSAVGTEKERGEIRFSCIHPLVFSQDLS